MFSLPESTMSEIAFTFSSVLKYSFTIFKPIQILLFHAHSSHKYLNYCQCLATPLHLSIIPQGLNTDEWSDCWLATTLLNRFLYYSFTVNNSSINSAWGENTESFTTEIIKHFAFPQNNIYPSFTLVPVHKSHLETVDVFLKNCWCQQRLNALPRTRSLGI